MIELTDPSGMKILVNPGHITCVYTRNNQCVYELTNSEAEFGVKETYEEVKQLLRNWLMSGGR